MGTGIGHFLLPGQLGSAKSPVGYVLVIQMALCIHEFHMHGFNQPQMENIRKKLKLQQLKDTNLKIQYNYLQNIYIVFGIVSNLGLMKYAGGYAQAICKYYTDNWYPQGVLDPIP